MTNRIFNEQKKYWTARRLTVILRRTSYLAPEQHANFRLSARHVKSTSGASSIHIQHLKRDLELVRRKVAKKIGLLCRSLMSTAALRLSRQAALRREVMSVTIFKPFHFVAVSTWSCRGRRLARAGAVIARALSESFPSRCQPISPSFIKGLPGLEYLTKTFHTDISDINATVKPSCPNTKKRVEWLNMSGLERPRKTFSLARDDLEAALAF